MIFLIKSSHDSTSNRAIHSFSLQVPQETIAFTMSIIFAEAKYEKLSEKEVSIIQDRGIANNFLRWPRVSAKVGRCVKVKVWWGQCHL